MMPNPSLYQINTRVWLRDLADRLGRPATLADIPDDFLDHTAALGFDYLWFLGLWQTGPAGRRVSLSHTEWLPEFRALLPDFTLADVVASPFAVAAYTLHRDFGRPSDLLELKARLYRRGLKLMVDFVPNHTALDHPWVEAHPEFYIQGSAADLAREPHNYCRTAAGPILAHGRDPNFPGWTDTLQLNYRHPGLRAAMAAVLLDLAASADGVRCDMAMLLLPDVIARTWGERSRPTDGSPPVDASFWPGVIRRVKARQAGFIFLAEAYWGLEKTLLSQGFDYAYDKELYDILLARDAPGVRAHLRAAPDDEASLAHFLENHDELRAARALPLPVHRAAALITYLLPGLRFFHEGQLQGRQAKVSMHLGRRPVEAVDPDLLRFYRQLLGWLERPEVRQGRWQLLEVLPAWAGNLTWDRFLAFAWEGEGTRLLLAVNYGPTQGQGYVSLPWPELAGPLILTDLATGAGYQRDGADLRARGLYVDLPAWGYHVLAW